MAYQMYVSPCVFHSSAGERTARFSITHSEDVLVINVEAAGETARRGEDRPPRAGALSSACLSPALDYTYPPECHRGAWFRIQDPP